jgi:hypothetical protein
MRQQQFLHKIMGGEKRPLLLEIPETVPKRCETDVAKEVLFGSINVEESTDECEGDLDDDSIALSEIIRNTYPLFKPAPFGFKCSQCRNCMKGAYGTGSIGRVDIRYSKVGTMSEIGYCKVQRTIVHIGWGCAAHNLQFKRRRELINAPTEYMDDEPAAYHGRRQLQNIELCRREKEHAVIKTTFGFLDKNVSENPSSIASPSLLSSTSPPSFKLPSLKSLGY